jgi:hypothetical protein
MHSAGFFEAAVTTVACIRGLPAAYTNAHAHAYAHTHAYAHQ